MKIKNDINAALHNGGGVLLVILHYFIDKKGMMFIIFYAISVETSAILDLIPVKKTYMNIQNKPIVCVKFQTSYKTLVKYSCRDIF